MLCNILYSPILKLIHVIHYVHGISWLICLTSSVVDGKDIASRLNMAVLEEVPLGEDDDVSLDMVASTPISTDLSVSSKSESSKIGKGPIIYSVDSFK